MQGISAPPGAARLQQWLRQVDSVLRNQGLQAAGHVALQALADGVEHPAILNLGAQARFGQGQLGEAVDLLQQARKLAPNDPHVLNSLAVCLTEVGRTDEAIDAYKAAIQVDPNLAAAHFNLGTVLEALSEIKGARSAYEEAAALDPKYMEPRASLAWLDAQAGDVAMAIANAEGALGLSPRSILARMALASADMQRGNVEGAAGRLSALIEDPALTPVNRAIVLGLIGDLNDRNSHVAEAFAAYRASNDMLKTLYAAQYDAPQGETVLGQARRLAAWFQTADPELWRQAPEVRASAADPKAHVFLVGFPRSGTTLLENVLAAHPDVVSLEEKECFAPDTLDYLMVPDGLERLARITPEEAVRQREHYWSAARTHGAEVRGKVFIDKMPLRSVALPAIAKLFPDAQVLFARRDPRDVVLSCFRRRFGMNRSMFQLLTLDGAAAYYDAVMKLSEIYRQLLPLPQHEVRYESLVDDLEGTTRAVCDFLGLQWTEEMMNFAARATTRGISTPSAAQVARGLNRDGQGAWRRYLDEMAPILPLLEPWVSRFGYQ